MKKIVLNIFCLLSFLIIAISCQDSSKDPFPDQVVSSSFVTLRIDPKKQVINVTDIANSSFSGTFNAPSGNTQKHIVTVRRVTTGGVSTEYFKIDEITVFPKTVNYKASDIALALGQNAADFLPGDRFDFECKSTGLDGTQVDYNSLSANLQAERGQAQGYRFNTYISCPFVQSEAIGSYEFTEVPCPFDPPGPTSPFMVVAGKNANQVKIINPFEDPLDPKYKWELVVNVNPNTGIATIVRDDAAGEKQSAFFQGGSSGATVFTDAYLETNPTQTSFFFSCTGVINIIARIRINNNAGVFSNFGYSCTSFKAKKI
jgi:hypothetical protein